MLPAYRAYILPYTRLRLEWMQRRCGTLDPEPLGQLSTASRFEIQSLGKVMANCLSPAERVSFSGLLKGMEKFWELPEVPVITLNSIFSGRKTAQLLKLAAYLEQNGFRSAVQVECSRFLARDHPELAAQLVTALVESLAAFL